jgi:hypothetical protein
MVEIIVCDKCGVRVPEQHKKAYKFLFWETKYSHYETDIFHYNQSIGIHLCNKCMSKLTDWLSVN